jgi:small-conductance mechanosensitive channel
VILRLPAPRRALAATAAVLAALALTGAPAPAAARTDPGAVSPAPGAPAAGPPAAVRLHNRHIATLRASVLGLTPAQRAETIAVRLQEALARGGPGAVEMTEAGEAWRFAVDGAVVFFLVAEDFGPLTAEQMALGADDARRRLERAVQESRELTDPRQLLRGAAFSAAATAVAFAVLSGVFWLRRRIQMRLAAAARRHLQRMQATRFGLHPESVLALMRWLTSAVTWIVALLALDIWLSYVLQQFAYTRPWGEELTAWLLGVLRDFALAIAGGIPGLVLAVLVFLIARSLTRLNTLFLERVERGRLALGWLDADTAGPTRRIGNFVIWLFALAMAYPYLPGADTDAFKGLSVLVGLMVSLGASNVVGQALSGLTLMYARSLRQGEYVKIGETEGTVTSIGMFATRVHTGMGEEVTIPNTVIVGNPVRNFSRLAQGGAFVLHTTVTIGYATPWRQVHAILLEAARRTPGVAQDPAPFVAQTALSDYYVEYRLVAQANKDAPRRRAEALNALHANIQDAFNEHGVQIMSPHYIADPPQPQVVPPEKWYAPPAHPPADGAPPR